MRRLILPILPAVFALVLATLAEAAPTGLIVIPTAQFMPAGRFRVQYQSDGADLPLGTNSDSPTRFVESEIGIADRAETGLDRVFGADNGFIWNAKIRLWGNENSPTAGAVGIQNVTSFMAAQPFAVALFTSGRAQFHYGIISTSGLEAMFGFTYEFSDRLMFQSDYTTGPDSVSSYGFQFTFNAALSVTLGVVKSNTGPEPAQKTIQITWTTPVRF